MSCNDDVVLFRIRDRRLTTPETAMFFLSLFTFYIRDFDVWAATSWCVAENRGDFLQLEIRLPGSESGVQHPLLHYMSSQLKNVLKRLPARSAAFIEEICL
jgi:hypothetical protein